MYPVEITVAEFSVTATTPIAFITVAAVDEFGGTLSYIF